MPSPQLRTPFDRTRQVILYEAGALTFAAPLLSFFTKETAAQSLALLVTTSIVAMLWTAAYCTCFDMLEARATNRSADSARSPSVSSTPSASKQVSPSSPSPSSPSPPDYPGSAPSPPTSPSPPPTPPTRSYSTSSTTASTQYKFKIGV